MKVVRKLLDILSRRGRVQLAILVVLLCSSALLETVAIASIMPFMALVVSPSTIQTNKWLHLAYEWLGFADTRSFLLFVGGGVLAILILTNAAKTAGVWLTAHYQNRQLYHLRWRLLASYMARPYSFFLGRNTAELGSTLLHETSGVVDRVLRPVVDIIANGTTTIMVMVLLVVLDPSVALGVTVVIGGSYITVYMLEHRKLARLGEVQIVRVAGMHRSVAEAMGGIKELKVLGRELTFLERFTQHARPYALDGAYSAVVGQVPRYVLEATAFGGILVVILYFVSQGKQAVDIVPMLALYAFAGYRLLPTLHNLFVAMTLIRYNVPALDLVHGELNTSNQPAKIIEKALRDRRNAPRATFTKALELQNVTFQYDTAPAPSLNQLNLRVLPNTSIGLVGPTGCGKTTTVDVILGLLTPQGGKLVLDGVEITDANRASWQRTIGYVPQHIYISDDTVARNIAFGVPDDELDMEAVRKAAVMANLAEFVESSMPEGYDTRIGERGVRLSGGQRQRIGIARAIYHDPSILIMDEATSALDGITEDSVMRAIHNLSGRKTIILIAHRLTTVRDCDVIYQLDKGGVMAQGTYDELMQNSSWFRSAAAGKAETA